MFIVYELISVTGNAGITLRNCLFGEIRLTKNADIDKNKYSGYGVGNDSKGSFSFPGDRFVPNVIIFGADMSSSVHTNNKTKSILILGEGLITQELDDTTLTAEKMY